MGPRRARLLWNRTSPNGVVPKLQRRLAGPLMAEIGIQVTAKTQGWSEQHKKTSRFDF